MIPGTFFLKGSVATVSGCPCILSGEVVSASCSCVAGKVGFCNHILAMMFKMCKFTLFSSTTSKVLIEEQDQQSSVACTSQLQQWHKNGGGENMHLIQ